MNDTSPHYKTYECIFLGGKPGGSEEEDNIIVFKLSHLSSIIHTLRDQRIKYIIEETAASVGNMASNSDQTGPQRCRKA